MRVLWLSHNVPYPPVGGVLQRNYHLVRALASQAEVHLVALRQRALCPDAAALHEARHELEQLCTSVRIFPIDWDEMPAMRPLRALPVVFGRQPYIAARYYSAACHRALAEATPERYDVVHLDTIGLVPYWRHLAGPPAVLNHHNVESTMLRRRAEQAPQGWRKHAFAWQSGAVGAWEATYCPRVATNIVVSELDGERLREIVPDAQTAVVPNGVDIDYFDMPVNTNPGARGIVLVGEHSWYPNRDAVEYFLDAIWPHIIAAEPKAECILIGRNPCARALTAAAADARVRVLGFVDDLRDAVQDAAVFACPFRLGGGTRLKVLDALAMRKALVSTTLGVEGIPVVDGRHGLLADTPEAFAARVVDCVRDPALRARLGEAGRRLVVDSFDWSAVGRRLYDVYAAIAAGKPAAVSA